VAQVNPMLAEGHLPESRPLYASVAGTHDPRRCAGFSFRTLSTGITQPIAILVSNGCPPPKRDAASAAR